MPDLRKLPQVFWFGSVVRLTFRCWAFGHRWSEWVPATASKDDPEWVRRYIEATERRGCLRLGCLRTQYRETADFVNMFRVEA